MTEKLITKAILRIYLEIVLESCHKWNGYFVFFGTPLSVWLGLIRENASIIVFLPWGAIEMSDLQSGALISILKHQYESNEALGLSKSADLLVHHHSADTSQILFIIHQSDHTND